MAKSEKKLNMESINFNEDKSWTDVDLENLNKKKFTNKIKKINSENIMNDLEYKNTIREDMSAKNDLEELKNQLAELESQKKLKRMESIKKRIENNTKLLLDQDEKVKSLISMKEKAYKDQLLARRMILEKKIKAEKLKEQILDQSVSDAGNKIKDLLKTKKDEIEYKTRLISLHDKDLENKGIFKDDIELVEEAINLIDQNEENINQLKTEMMNIKNLDSYNIKNDNNIKNDKPNEEIVNHLKNEMIKMKNTDSHKDKKVKIKKDRVKKQKNRSPKSNIFKRISLWSIFRLLILAAAIVLFVLYFLGIFGG